MAIRHLDPLAEKIREDTDANRFRQRRMSRSDVGEFRIAVFMDVMIDVPTREELWMNHVKPSLTI